jgi:alkylhydroperoxidase/carboxymuconolactone decarboxylase family protein YurZ
MEEILALARICSFVALRNETELRAEYIKALNSGVQLPVIREAVLQAYLFAGYAAAINAFIILNEVSEGNQEFLREESRSLQDWEERGEELCKKIYGSQYEKLVHNMKRLHPDLADWMLWEGYGKVLARPFLNLVVRELLIVAMTAVLQVERQFTSHVRGALNVGATSEQIWAVFEQTKAQIPKEIISRYDEIIKMSAGILPA